MSGKQPKERRINLELAPDLEAIYANFAVITHSPSEFILDFARVLPNMPKSKVYARIVTTPLHAKLLLRALEQNIERYEAKFGEIRIPSEGEDLARQFFGEHK